MGIFKKKAASEFDKPRDAGALKIMKEILSPGFPFWCSALETF